MNSVTGNLTSDAEALKKLLPAQDILLFPFETEAGMPFIAVYADGITDKELLGEQIARPLRSYRGSVRADDVRRRLTCPELRPQKDLQRVLGNIVHLP